MSITGVIVVFFVLVIGSFIFLTVLSSRKDQEIKQQMARSMGFTPIPADPALCAKISTLYQRNGIQYRYELQNVSKKGMPDGDIYLFDLINTSGEDNSTTESQAVAIISTYLSLPPFTMFPKSDEKYQLSGIANKILEWGTSFIGNPVSFPEFPVFNARYIITSNQPDLMHSFVDERIARFFSQTQMYSLHASENIFTFSELEPGFNTSNPNNMNQRANRAMEIFRVLQK